MSCNTWSHRLLLLALLLRALCMGLEFPEPANATYKSNQHERGTHNSTSYRELLGAGIGRRTSRRKISGCSIYILDLNELAKENGLPQCSLNDIVVDARTQVPYLREFSTANKAKRVIPSPHYFSGNSAPWFTRRAVERSGYQTHDPAAAAVVLVDDYCFKLWWLSYIHSDRADQLPGERLLQLYSHMLRRPEWTAAAGARHAFFQSHTGFAHGPLGDLYERFLCDTLVNSMHVVNVRASRLRCKRAPYNPDNFLIAPGSVHYHDIAEFQERERERLLSRGRPGAHHDRDFLLFFKGKCTPLNFTWKAEAVRVGIAESTINVGKLMRVHIVQQIQGLGREVRAACTGDAGEVRDVQAERPHWEQMDEFTRSTFCLLVPGDSQTSRRLPEAIMAGCVPVFPGPPYHTMPFADLIDYSKFAIFFRFTSAPWADSINVRWKIDKGDPKKRPHHPTDSEWWVPDVENVRDLAIEVDGAAAMVAHLRDLPEATIVEKQRAVLAVRSQFAYLEASSAGSSAADLIADTLCTRWAKQQAAEGGAALAEPQPVLDDLPALGAADGGSAARAGRSDGAATTAAGRASERGEGEAGENDAENGGHEERTADPALVVRDRVRQRRKRRKERSDKATADQSSAHDR